MGKILKKCPKGISSRSNYLILRMSSGVESNSAHVLEPNNDLLIKVQTTQSEVQLVSPIIVLKELIGKKI